MTEYIPHIALSFSRLSDYEDCPLKFESKYILKDYPDDSDNPAFVKGNAIHKQVEDYINWMNSRDGEAPTMGVHTKDVVPMLENIYESSKGQMHAEKQIAVDQDWNKCDWFAKPNEVKYRAVIDFMAFISSDTLLLGDIKSGKMREYEDGPTTQLRLTAAMCFSLFPNIKNITTAYFFVEHKKTVQVSFTRDQLEELKAPFDSQHEAVNVAKEFPFKKNKYCNWCDIPPGRCPVKKD